MFDKIPDIDIHSLRAEYAKSIYAKYDRNRNEYKNERMILYHNRLVTTYTDKSVYSFSTSVSGKCQQIGK